MAVHWLSRTLAQVLPGAQTRNATPVKAPAASRVVPAERSHVLYVSTAADGPPTDGSVFWYVTDLTC
jgi:hypothetical protein